MLRWKKFFTHERNSITSLGNILQVTFNFLGSTSICICWTIVAMWHESQYGGAMLGLIQGSNKIFSLVVTAWEISLSVFMEMNKYNSSIGRNLRNSQRIHDWLRLLASQLWAMTSSMCISRFVDKTGKQHGLRNGYDQRAVLGWRDELKFAKGTKTTTASIGRISHMTMGFHVISSFYRRNDLSRKLLDFIYIPTHINLSHIKVQQNHFVE
jgi:hypothetical protein